MSQPKKRKAKNKKPYQEQTTFDPKIHHRSKGSSGYGLKRNHIATAEETSGLQLAHILNPK